MTMAQIKLALDNINGRNDALSANTETLSGIEPLGSISDVSPNYSPKSPGGVPSSKTNSLTKTSAANLVSGKKGSKAAGDDSDLFSPLGEAKNGHNERDIAANDIKSSKYAYSSKLQDTKTCHSLPATQEKDLKTRDYIPASTGHDGHRYNNENNFDRKANSDHGVGTAEMVVNRQLFVRKDHHTVTSEVAAVSSVRAGDGIFAKNHVLHSELENNGVDLPGSISNPQQTGAGSNLDVRSKSPMYHYNVQNDRMDINRQSPDALSIHSADSVPPHYHHDDVTEESFQSHSAGGKGGGGSDLQSSQGASNLPVTRFQPSSSSPKGLSSRRDDPFLKGFQSSQSLPPELMEIESLRQNLSNMLSPSGGASLARNDSLSDLLMQGLNSNMRPPRQSSDSTKTDSLIGAQAFQEISPTLDPAPLDSGLASHQTSHLTSSQRSGASIAESSLRAENRMLRDSLDRERCRRKHCEEQIAVLQGRILEHQQLLAVAQATEKKKDNMIAQLDKTMAKVSASLQQREREKIAALDKLKSANDALLQEIDKQNIIITEQKKELVEIRQKIEKSKHSERAVREQLKQHQVESTKRWEEEQQRAQLTRKQVDNLGEECLKAERQLKQVQGILSKERDEWRQKEVELEEKVSSSEMEHSASVDEMQRKLEDEKRKVDDSKKELVKLRREVEELGQGRDKAIQEKENAKLELSLQEARWEAKLQKQEAESREEHETATQQKIERIQRESTETEASLREAHRKQVADMNERHQEELRMQGAGHQREMTQREHRWVERQKQYQTRLVECQQEILKLTTKLEKVHHHRYGLVGKLQTFLQTQCNEAMMMISDMDASPAPSVASSRPNLIGSSNLAGKILTTHSSTPMMNTARQDHQQMQQPGTRDQAFRVRGQSDAVAMPPQTNTLSEKVLSSNGQPVSISQAQEQAMLAIRRLQLSQDRSGAAPHEASFHPLPQDPSSPTASEASHGISYQDISTSGFYSLPSYQTGTRSDVTMETQNVSRTTQLASSPVKPAKQYMHPSSSVKQPVPEGGHSVPLAEQTTTSFRELETQHVNASQVMTEYMEFQSYSEEDEFAGWMSQHEATLTSSPTKETPSPDYNIHPGQGLTLHIPPSTTTATADVSGGVSSGQGGSQAITDPTLGLQGIRGGPHHHHFDRDHDQNASELSSGPLDMLGSPVSQDDWKEVKLQQYIAKLLEKSPTTAEQVNMVLPMQAPRHSTHMLQQKQHHQQQHLQKHSAHQGIIQKEAVQVGPPITTAPPGQVRRANVATSGRQQQQQPVGQARGRVDPHKKSLKQGPHPHPQTSRPPVGKDKSQKQSSVHPGPSSRHPHHPPSTGSHPVAGSNRPRSAMSRDRAGSTVGKSSHHSYTVTKPAPKPGVWR